MSFISQNDYDVQMRNEVLAILNNTENTSIASAELKAQAQMEESLNLRYDVGLIFGAIGNARNPIVIMYLIDIALYHLHSKLATRMIPKIREDRFLAAKEWLKLVRSGELNPDLPTHAETLGNYRIRLGCNIKHSQDW
jgi:hypothetical protein